MNRKIARSLSALLVLTAVAVTQVPVANAEAQITPSDFEMDGNTLVKYTGTAEVVSVPNEVKKIGEEAFADNDSIVKVSVGEKVEGIGYRAFAECDNLRSIDVSDSVIEIDSAAFSNNKELRNVSLGAGIRKLGTGVFAGSPQLDSISVSEENPYLMYSEGVLYDDEMTKIYALMPGCEKYAYTVPSTVSEIAGYAFWGNPYLEHITLGSGLYEVPAYAFSNCMNLKEVDIPFPTRSIEAKAFEDCVNLKKVAIPDSVTRISDTAFDGCPLVTIEASPGSYGAEYALLLKKTEVEEVEYEDVQPVQIINEADLADEKTVVQAPATVQSTPESDATPLPTIGAVTESYFPPNLLGESSIVAGSAMIFIDNRKPTVLNGKQTIEKPLGENTLVENLLVENEQKGKDFPKYTIVGDTKIAALAFYQQKEMEAYQIEDNIREIGEFAFARSGITETVIPDGVTSIGYGAFYHCDSLEKVTIPDSVTEIEPYAFAQTPWQETTQTEDYPFLVVGDGILIAYAGSESVVNIPTKVKQIGPGVFKDHMGITAVNIPSSTQIIGEEAFMDCRNLKTVNGGKNLVEIRDRAFMNCPLSQVVIPATVEKIGLGAYALSDGTDTVTFEGTQLPILTTAQGAKRLANDEYRTYAFKQIRTAIVPTDTTIEGTVLETGTYGFNGIVCDEAGNLLADNQAGVPTSAATGITMLIDSKNIPADAANSMATIPGKEGNFILSIQDSEDAFAQITAAYGELYGGREPVNLSAYEISLYDATGSIPITRLGKQYMRIQVPMPKGVAVDGLHVVSLDEDGQLEAVEHRIVTMEDGDYLQFLTSHFSPFGIYQYSGINGKAQVVNGKAVISSFSGNKDDTPDTGDGLSPKWFLAAGLLAMAIALFFFKWDTTKTG